MQHAHAFEPMQDGRIYIEKLNGPFLSVNKGTPAEYKAALDLRLSGGGSRQAVGLKYLFHVAGRSGTAINDANSAPHRAGWQALWWCDGWP